MAKAKPPLYVVLIIPGYVIKNGLKKCPRTTNNLCLACLQRDKSGIAQAIIRERDVRLAQLDLMPTLAPRLRFDIFTFVISDHPSLEAEILRLSPEAGVSGEKVPFSDGVSFSIQG
jgi:hypothetical protein